MNNTEVIGQERGWIKTRGMMFSFLPVFLCSTVYKLTLFFPVQLRLNSKAVWGVYSQWSDWCLDPAWEEEVDKTPSEIRNKTQILILKSWLNDQHRTPIQSNPHLTTSGPDRLPAGGGCLCWRHRVMLSWYFPPSHGLYSPVFVCCLEKYEWKEERFTHRQ